ncbi:MAG: type I-E CRISPR-associated protein Cse1/CasA, partial [Firmicutes bacterium]|nr:type I-E CRISPR-associated protein Cse1/CasA [Bacillota bacterium]
GVIKWIKRLCEYGSLERGYFIDLMTAAVIYDYGQATSLPVIDYISDSVTFHSQLLLDSGKIWRDVINEEIAKCEKAAKKVYNLSVNLQEVSGASGDRITGGDAKVQFYDRIDRTFRLWLEELDAESDKYKEYADKLEDKIFIIARDFGYELVGQTSANAIFGRYKKPENNEKCTSSAQALNLYISSIKKIFNKAGDKK